MEKGMLPAENGPVIRPHNVKKVDLGLREIQNVDETFVWKYLLKYKPE
jgi:hypothetical protein